MITSEQYFSGATLTRDQQVRLLQLTKASGYEILQDIMEKVCQFAETAHFQLSPKDYDDSKIARSHAEARGQRLLMERTMAKVLLEITTLLKEQAAEGRGDGEPEEPSDENLLDPTMP